MRNILIGDWRESNQNYHRDTNTPHNPLSNARSKQCLGLDVLYKQIKYGEKIELKYLYICSYNSFSFTLEREVGNQQTNFR